VKKGRSSKNAPTFREAPVSEPKAAPAAGKYVCSVCGYVYDPAAGDPENRIAPGTRFEDLPANWVCPVCGVGKDKFAPAE
jgi:rubredoxin